jgi:hypothetical protein
VPDRPRWAGVVLRVRSSARLHLSEWWPPHHDVLGIVAPSPDLELVRRELRAWIREIGVSESYGIIVPVVELVTLAPQDEG